MPKLLEYVVKDFVKVVYLCNDDGSAEALGDLPALPYCFTHSECVGAGSTKVCWSEWFEVGVLQVRVESAAVGGDLASISFQARGVRCGDDPERVYSLVREHVLKTCSVR
ncbi:MAG: hypothetical protein QXX81_00360 [Zestosphaera sp.]